MPLRFDGYTDAQFREGGFRVVPPATVRAGAFIGRNVVLMPSYVNIGAYVDEGTMVDTWATVGSCAQIGKNVHLSGGVGIGGVLEPLQANPTIIEDNCFIGARSEIVEGVVVEAHSVLSMGVFIGQSTKIYDRATGEVHYGRVPSGSVVVPGSLPSADGKHSLACAVIVKRVDARRAPRRRSTSCCGTDRWRTVSAHRHRDSSETLELARRLIACRSVTPDDGGCARSDRARAWRRPASRASGSTAAPCGICGRGAARGAPLVCLAGHVDVVPPGPLDRWTSDPFTPTERDGCLFGRGAADMKTSVAAMVTAAERFVARRARSPRVARAAADVGRGRRRRRRHGGGGARAAGARRTDRRLHHRRADVASRVSATRSRTGAADR